MSLIRELKLSRKPDCSLWLYLNQVCVKPEMNLRFGLNVRSLDRIGNHFYRLECSTHLRFMHKRAIPSAKYRSQKGYVTIFIAQGWLNKLMARSILIWQHKAFHSQNNQNIFKFNMIFNWISSRLIFSNERNKISMILQK